MMIPKGPITEVSSRATKEGRWKKRKIRYLPGRIIVKFKPVPEDAERTARSLVDDVSSALPDGALIRPLRGSGRAVFALDPGASVGRLAERISKRDDVEYAEPDVVDSAAVIPTDTRFSDQWGPTKVAAPAGWDLETGTSNILIGIVDSGISMSSAGGLDHPDLNDPTRYILGTDFVDGGTPRDLNGHGTHVAGIAGAESNNAQGVAGMNWDSPLYICRTLDAAGNGSSADFADAVEEIVDYAVANGMKAVINYSAGGGANQTKRDACEYVNDHGMILCAATGNDYGGSVIYPAAYSTQLDGVVAVGSTDDDDTVSDFSNVGPEVSVVAPGRDILSTMPTYAVAIPVGLNYGELDGTSMATPLVTGLTSLMWSRHPSFSNKKIRDCLTGTAKKLGTGSFDNAWGHGRVDAEKALRCGDLIFTGFTRFTAFTRWTRFTAFTRWTRFTPFTRLTRFTRFAPFTPHEGYARFVQPRPPAGPFIRFGNKVFAPEELDLRRFEELQGVAEELFSVGINYIDQIATSDVLGLAEALNYSPEETAKLVELAQDLLRSL
jgi:hypothetical protein